MKEIERDKVHKKREIKKVISWEIQKRAKKKYKRKREIEKVYGKESKTDKEMMIV